MGKKHAGGHGGAWKVAYADFVTAMMALFMVLWIVSQDDEVLIFTSKYFQNPFNSPLERSTGIMNDAGSGMSFGGDENGGVTQLSSMIDIAFLHSLAKELYRLLDAQEEEMEESPVDIKVVDDGLRITLFDGLEYPLFKDHTAEFTEWGEYIMQNLAWLVDRYNFRVRIDSYTFAGYESPDKQYTVWELTSDQANAARRSLVRYALESDKIERVTGYGDQNPLKGMEPNHRRNQRLEISLVIESK